MHTTTFTAPQQAALAAIADGANKTEAARVAGVHRDTIYHWERTVPGFRDAILLEQEQRRQAVAAQLRRVAAKALDQLERLLDNPDTPPSVLFRAIQFALTRPRFPDKEWALPENVNEAPIQQMQESMAVIEADYKAMCHHDAVRNHVPDDQPIHEQHFPPSRHVSMGENPRMASDVSDLSDVSGAPDPRTPRNATSPCGSGKKYKRCCGQTAPPLLSRARSTHAAGPRLSSL
jgi:uncharacterized protein YecA (UPF0149 family)